MGRKKKPNAFSKDSDRMDWMEKRWGTFKKERKKPVINAKTVKQFLEVVDVPTPTRPAVYGQWGGTITRVLEEERGIPMTKQAAMEISRWANTQSRALAKTQLFESKSSPTMSQERFLRVCKEFWNKEWKDNTYKTTALAVYLAGSTGARLGEVLGLWIEDLEKSVDNGCTFIRFPLRVSKTNANKSRPESLILSVSGKEEIPILRWMTGILNGREKGLLFPGTTNAKINAHLKALYKKMNWKNPPTGHGLRGTFVVNSLDAGASKTDIVNQCRWQTFQMIDRYSNQHRQCTTKGPAHVIAELKQVEEGRRIEERNREHKKRSEMLEALLPKKPTIQLAIRAPTKTVACQTDPEVTEDKKVMENDPYYQRWQKYFETH
ncbi:Oidioi.mRNA.OKI2018_I69.chr2.g8098.t1.cds [Oikopleura dioica]|uniref:Oidioi.mRNA.OKI2018_I69.chr2.g8098.t1.cds n=1 Tax=Oikopleura dioica TaxID=34765 RepID=A0ABN7TEH0_OIKDI|nr:Oidioi.mRNA.OKI2018_I69.chr2.g8098.t1.cds [Oikopleura dioica]